jgi:hypothetical protein
MYMMTSTRCGISAKQMERELGVNYKTAARMMRLIGISSPCGVFCVFSLMA